MRLFSHQTFFPRGGEVPVHPHLNIDNSQLSQLTKLVTIDIIQLVTIVTIDTIVTNDTIVTIDTIGHNWCMKSNSNLWQAMEVKFLKLIIWKLFKIWRIKMMSPPRGRQIGCSSRKNVSTSGRLHSRAMGPVTIGTLHLILVSKVSLIPTTADKFSRWTGVRKSFYKLFNTFFDPPPPLTAI